MAARAGFTILECEQVLPLGSIGHEHVDVAGIYVDMLVISEGEEA
jgi:acyl CoA:acetate/3-ketoacid CoA transferase alpha subunit